MKNIPKLKVKFVFFLHCNMNGQAKLLNFTTANDGLFLFSFRTGVGPKKGRVSPLLIQHVSDCWMTERPCRALWLSGLDPDGRRWWGSKEKMEPSL